VSTRETGGPAFPTTEFFDEKPVGQLPGMTLRDYFAGKAMHAELNTAGMHAGAAAALNAAAKKARRTVERQIAFNAYMLADAMLAERAK